MTAHKPSLDELIDAKRHLVATPPPMRRALRDAADVSLADVAYEISAMREGAAARPVVTAQAVWLWEQGKRTPRGSNLISYARVLRKLRESS